MPQAKPLWREYLEALLVAVVFATFARTFIVQAFKIPSGSMEPNLLVGDHILVNKFIYAPVRWPAEAAFLPRRPVRRGDVVVFKYPVDPSRDFIKRCVGLPGDLVGLRDKQLYINGRFVDQRAYIENRDPRTYPRTPFLPDSLRRRDNFGPFAVPPDHYFCLGDNRDNSNDSRFWGPVPASYVKGRALLIYWSFPTAEEQPGAQAGPRWRQLGRVATGFFTDTRWERTFRIVR
jgi:signal peptidase I